MLLAGWTVMLANATVHAEGFNSLEKFNCGGLGPVMIFSSLKPTLAARHLIYQARIVIPSKKINQVGVLHSLMGGNDRTFTKKTTDDYRSIDETSLSNPVIMSILGKGYFYGKERQNITVTTLRESYSCIPS